MYNSESTPCLADTACRCGTEAPSEQKAGSLFWCWVLLSEPGTATWASQAGRAVRCGAAAVCCSAAWCCSGVLWCSAVGGCGALQCCAVLWCAAVVQMRCCGVVRCCSAVQCCNAVLQHAPRSTALRGCRRPAEEETLANTSLHSRLTGAYRCYLALNGAGRKREYLLGCLKMCCWRALAKKGVSRDRSKGRDVTLWGLENREWRELMHPSCKELSLRCEAVEMTSARQ